MNDAGKIAFTPKGDYSSTVTYEYLDTVVYDGNAYAALKTTTGNAPEEGSEYWALLARGGTSVPVATEDTMGAVKASDDIGVDSDAKMILRTDFAPQENLTELESGESRNTFFGKIAKAVSELISHINVKASTSATGHVKLSDSSAVTDSTGLALPATEKNASISGTMANQISELNTNLTAVKSTANKAVKENTAAITMSNTTIFTKMGQGYVTKAGAMCSIHIAFIINKEIKANTKLFSLNAPYNPTTAWGNTPIINLTDRTIYAVLIQQDGVYAGITMGTGTYVLDFSYPVVI